MHAHWELGETQKPGLEMEGIMYVKGSNLCSEYSISGNTMSPAPSSFLWITNDSDTSWRCFEDKGGYSRLLMEVVFHQALVKYWKQQLLCRGECTLLCCCCMTSGMRDKGGFATCL